MDASVLVGLELPPLAAAPAGAGPVAMAAWRNTVEAAVRADLGAVWVTGAPVAGPGLTCESCTLAASLVAATSTPVLGVVSTLPGDRHPAVLARDVTSLDVVSSGRAAVLLRWDEGAALAAPAEGPAPAEQLAEAAIVCRAVLADPDPVFEGRVFHVAGAVNRPPPVRAGGPPVLVEVPQGWGQRAGERAAGAGVGDRLLGPAAAVVTGGTDDDVAACRQAVDAYRSTTAGPSEGTPVAVLWRGVLPGNLEGDIGLATACRHAGADGIVVQLEGGGALDGARTTDGGAVSRLVAALEAFTAPWRY